MSCRSSNSILYGVDDLIESWLEIASDKYGAGTARPRYGSTTAAKELSRKEEPSQPFPAKMLLGQITENWERGERQERSTENWRWKPMLEMEGNTGEKELEKLVAFLYGKSSWTNQIPVCSGLMPARDKDGKRSEEGKRAIDLGRKIDDGVFEFIALKFRISKKKKVITGDSHPLYAALELLEYGLLYVFARLNLKPRGEDNGLSEARKVHLVVLGPQEWCRDYNFERLSETINCGLNDLLKDQSFVMDFSFRQLSDCFIASYPDFLKAIGLFRKDFSEYRSVEVKND